MNLVWARLKFLSTCADQVTKKLGDKLCEKSRAHKAAIEIKDRAHEEELAAAAQEHNAAAAAKDRKHEEELAAAARKHEEEVAILKAALAEVGGYRLRGGLVGCGQHQLG